MLENPELKGLTVREIEIWRDEYKVYREKVLQQGDYIVHVHSSEVEKINCKPNRSAL